MRLFILAAAFATVWGAHSAAAQSASAAEQVPDSEKDRIALSARPATKSTEKPMRLACAPLVGQVFEPNGSPIVGATLFVKGTHQAYVTDSEGKFQLTDTVYEGQLLEVEAAGYTTQQVSLTDCVLPRLVLAQDPTARFKTKGKRAGQVIRLNNRNTNLK